jgi:DNA-binding response OmpR family regulator
VCTVLERGGFATSGAADGQEGLKAFYSVQPDLVVLDVVMPGLDGWEVLGRIREMSDVPIIMLTAQDTELEKVRGLKGGADDYVTKPFGRQELLARVHALLRRGGERAASAPDVYSDPLLSLDFGQRTVSVLGEEVALTPNEYKLLAALVRNSGQVLSHEQLLELVWGDAMDQSRDQVKLYVGYLRRKLGTPPEGSPVETVRGFGYRYRPPKSV